jgi:5'(3')-deoxyribonucleotidase
MDGVLADFNAAARQTLRAPPEDESRAAAEGRWPPEEWNRLKSVPNFFRNLPKTQISDDLVELARRFRDDLGWNISVLTAIPKHNDMPDAFQDKIEWIQQHYPDLRVRFGPYSKDKQCHAQAGDYLVDDRRDNCAEWTEAGGVAIRVIDHRAPDAVNELRSVYDRKQSFRQLAGQLPTQV